jgi:signal peptidase II
VTDDSRPGPTAGGLPAQAATPPSGSDADPVGVIAVSRRGRRRWPLFIALALAIVAVDQLAKALVTGALAPGQSVDVIGDLVRIVFGQNSGALFGLFKDNAAMFGAVSLVVVGLIVAYHARATPSLYLTITLGLLLGGAIGNMVDRLRLGYVVDFVDAGIGRTRFYTFNIADSAISLAIVLLFVAAIRPSLIDGAGSRKRGSSAPSIEAPASVDPDWGDGLGPDDRPAAGPTR